MFREIDTAQGIAVIGAMTLFFIAGVGMLSKPVPLPQITVSVRSQSAQVSSALDNGLIGWWKLDEGSGTTASDSSQNGNTGTLMPSSNLPVWTNGLVGQALSFNGVINGNSANMVMLPIAFGNRLSSTTGTVSAWVKMNNWNDGKNDPMVLLYKAGTDYIELFHNGSNKILGQLVVAGNAYAPSYSIPSGFSGWHHLAFTWNAAAGNVILFVDGQIANTATGFPGFYKFPNANCFGVLYCNPTDVAAAFNGSLDDVRIYNRALSASEIQQIFTLDSGNQTGSSGTSTTTTSSSPDTNATATSTQLAVPTGSTTYYIDYAVGNDANIGTSPSSPWQHSPGDPNAVGNPKLATLKPGDTVAFKGGVVYQFPSTGGYIGAMASGSSGSPITYISGNLLPVPWPDANSQAVIDGTNSTLNGRGTNNGIITLGSYSWLVVDGFEIRNSHPFVDATQMAYTAGISWGGQSAGSGNITIKNNYIHDLAMDGVYIYGKWDAAPANQVPSNFNIVGNRIMRTNGHGLLQSRGFNNVVIENNYFDLNGTDFNHTGQTDIQADNIFLTAYNTTAGNTQYNTIIRNNIFKKSDVSLGYAPTKSHILISNQENANIYGNIFTGQPAVASIDAGWPIHGLNIFNNVFTANIFTFTGLIDFHAISATTIFSGVNIINNTFVGSPAHGGVIDVTSGNANNMTILNNIIDGNPDSGNFAKFGYQTDVFFGTGLLDYASLQINNNVYNSAMTKPFYDDGSYFNLASWKTAMQGKGVSGFDANSTFGAVSFVNRAGGDLHLTSSDTRARGQGVNLTSYCSSIPALCLDKDGNRRPSTGSWDIGAYEYCAGNCSSSQQITNTPITNPVITNNFPVSQNTNNNNSNNAVNQNINTINNNPPPPVTNTPLLNSGANNVQNQNTNIPDSKLAQNSLNSSGSNAKRPTTTKTPVNSKSVQSSLNTVNASSSTDGNLNNNIDISTTSEIIIPPQITLTWWQWIWQIIMGVYEQIVRGIKSFF